LRRLGWNVEAHDDHFEQVTKDEQLLPAVSAAGWVFITQDSRIRYRAAERSALMEHRLRAFVLVTASLSADATIAILGRAREKMEEMAQTIDGPFLVRIAKDGNLRRLL